MKQQLNEQQKGVTFQQHQQWLDHPITKQLLEVLGGHKDNIILALSQNAGIADKDSVVCKEKNSLILSVQLKTTETLTRVVKDTEVFIANLYNKKQQ